MHTAQHMGMVGSRVCSKSSTLSCAQVTTSRVEASDLRRAREELEAAVSVGRAQSASLHANVSGLQHTISELGIQLADARAAARGGAGVDVVEGGRFREVEGRAAELEVELTNTKEVGAV